MTVWKYGYGDYVCPEDFIPDLKREGIKGIIIVVEKEYSYRQPVMQKKIKEALAAEGYHIKKERQGYLLIDSNIRIKIKRSCETCLIGENYDQKVLTCR